MNVKEGEILLVDKPLEWTSFDVVNKLRYEIRRAFGLKKVKVGHGGTLDPLATGLLIIAVGPKTKQLETHIQSEKEYSGTIMLGVETPSHDKETEPSREDDVSHITAQMVQDAAMTFVGDIEQVPPMFSAKKVGGKKAYEHARKGKELELKPASIHIEEFKVDTDNLPEVGFYLKCSKGTYVRALARDLGKSLRTVAYLTSLRREASGQYRVDDARSIEEWVEHIRSCKVTPHA